ncbi:hypothetical protein [Paracoccus sp. MC1862]|uniref:hypothetical protein n=1 Tax=Paracoccus sp. MC1862 TaxID=2760307 RepID=UPI00190AA770|nr:hypothetical protein [Paracoccus sp. MC1862]QQO46010.1 hypothetical protein JGR78_06960 [Paracoccus sp. MC1862]
MTPTHSRLRQQAEIAFAKAQSQFLARERAVAELDDTAAARKEKTSRLRTARLAREVEDRARAPRPAPQNAPQGSDLQANHTSDRIQT